MKTEPKVMPIYGVHYVYGDYVLTGVVNAFTPSQKLAYWLSKKGWTKAMYCFSADNEEDTNDQLKNIDSYIKLFQSTFENTPPQTGKEDYILRVTEEDVDGCGGKCTMYVRFERPITKTQRDRFGELLNEVKENDGYEDCDTEDMVCIAVERFIEETGISAEIAGGLANGAVSF